MSPCLYSPRFPAGDREHVTLKCPPLPPFQSGSDRTDGTEEDNVVPGDGPSDSSSDAL